MQINAALRLRAGADLRDQLQHIPGRSGAAVHNEIAVLDRNHCAANKRALQAKDSGSILPGIGGGLDLIDSICFTTPALYFYLQWVLLPAS